MIKIECKNGIAKIEIEGQMEELSGEMADIILEINDRFNLLPFPVKNHFWVAVSELVNETLMEESKR